MKPFHYQRATDVAGAIRAISSLTAPAPRQDAPASGAQAKFLAGGTNLIDLMKNGVETPVALIDINRVDLGAIEPQSDGGLRLGALARNTDTANHPAVRQRYPLLSRAILSGASPQLRNLATNGGNAMQRTRCPYFMDIAFPQCNKRAPGTGCGAINGVNRMHAIFGANEQCIAVHPSDMCVALAALDATVRVQGSDGERRIRMVDFHRLPGTTPQVDTDLKPDELIVSIDLPPSPYAAHSCYLKVRDRSSFDFALVAVAAALEIDGETIRSARIALGGVAPKPWRAESAEQSLAGQKVTHEVLEAAGREAVRGARPQRENAFKVELTRRAVARALARAGGIA